MIATRGCPHRCHFCNLRQIYAPESPFPAGGGGRERNPWPTVPLFRLLGRPALHGPRLCPAPFRGHGRAEPAVGGHGHPGQRQRRRPPRRSRPGRMHRLFLGLESFSEASLGSVNKAFNRVEGTATSSPESMRMGFPSRPGLCSDSTAMTRPPSKGPSTWRPGWDWMEPPSASSPRSHRPRFFVNSMGPGAC